MDTTPIKTTCPRCGGPELVWTPEALRAMRLAAGVGVRELARRVGKSPTLICHVERGTSHCPPYLLRAYRRL